jgi:hypothetical protein
VKPTAGNLHLWLIVVWLAYGLLRAVTMIGFYPVLLASLLAFACRWAAGQGLLSLPEGRQI